MLETAPSRRLSAALALLAAMALAGPSSAQEPPGEGEETRDTREIVVSVEDADTTTVHVEHERVPIPSVTLGVNQPFTVEVPSSWEVRRDVPVPGVFLGPPEGDPNSHPEMLLLRESDVALDAPETILGNLRAHAAAADWSLLEAEERDFGGVEGLWIVRRMPPVERHGERVSYAVKLPLGPRSLDVLATVPVERHEELEPAIRHMLLSIRPAEPAAADPGS